MSLSPEKVCLSYSDGNSSENSPLSSERRYQQNHRLVRELSRCPALPALHLVHMSSQALHRSSALHPLQQRRHPRGTHSKLAKFSSRSATQNLLPIKSSFLLLCFNYGTYSRFTTSSIRHTSQPLKHQIVQNSRWSSTSSSDSTTVNPSTMGTK